MAARSRLNAYAMQNRAMRPATAPSGSFMANQAPSKLDAEFKPIAMHEAELERRLDVLRRTSSAAAVEATRGRMGMAPGPSPAMAPGPAARYTPSMAPPMAPRGAVTRNGWPVDMDYFQKSTPAAAAALMA